MLSKLRAVQRAVGNSGRRMVPETKPRRLRLSWALPIIRHFSQPAAATVANGTTNAFFALSHWEVGAAMGAAGLVVLFVVVQDHPKMFVFCEHYDAWNAQLSSQDVQAFVQEVLQDETINMSAVPDYVEKQLYEFTVRLVLGMVYDSLGGLHDSEILGGHVISLFRSRDHDPINAKLHTGIDEGILEEVADRLLKNPAINSLMIPDVVEVQLYRNCLKIVFRLLDTLANTFCITICGHDLKLHFQPSLKKMAKSSETRIDIGVLRDHLKETIDESSALTKPLMLGIYTLILGVLDDILANTELEVLNDRIRLDVVPVPKQSKLARALHLNQPPPSAKATSGGTGTMLPAGTLTFLFGATIGVATTVLLSRSK